MRLNIEEILMFLTVRKAHGRAGQSRFPQSVRENRCLVTNVGANYKYGVLTFYVGDIAAKPRVYRIIVLV